MSVETRDFGTLPDGRSASLFTITNASGAKACVTNYGAILVGLEAPDRDGRLADVTLGFDTLEQYVTGNDPYLGVVAGRYANRIAGGAFTLDGVTYQLATNDGGVNHLHGGNRGLDKVLWDASLPGGEDGSAVQLTYVSPDGEENYPGALTVEVTYEWSDGCELVISYKATTDRATILNLTNHSYFDLSASAAANVLDHVLEVRADRYTPVDATLIPTGELADVAGTPLDFRTPKRIGEDFAQVPGGYDHNFVLVAVGDGECQVRVAEPVSGRAMEMRTTEPGFQFYTGNFLDNVTGRGGAVYGPQGGFCLEAQHYPDSPNKPQFPSTVLRPGETYTQVTSYRFGVA